MIIDCVWTQICAGVRVEYTFSGKYGMSSREKSGLMIGYVGFWRHNFIDDVDHA